MSDKSVKHVTAEVLLRDRQSAEKVTRFLRERGIQVSAVGAASISIRSDAATFEQVFRARVSEAPPESVQGGVHDFGPGSRVSVSSDEEILVPDAIADAVEGVYIQQPPRLLR